MAAFFYRAHMKKSPFLATLVVTVCFLVSSSAQGATPKSLGKFGYWQTYLLYEGKAPVCYMTLTAQPPRKKKGGNKRGKVVLMITHRPAESAYDVVSYSIGTKFKPSSDVAFKADGKTFNLFTKADTAWAWNSATDRALTHALRKDYSVIIKGKTSSGEKVSDEVSLKGSNNAYKQISKACDITIRKLGK